LDDLSLSLGIVAHAFHPVPPVTPAATFVVTVAAYSDQWHSDYRVMVHAASGWPAAETLAEVGPSRLR
jgi:hypothetical protein